jgi:phosphate-selective porin
MKRHLAKFVVLLAASVAYGQPAPVPDGTNSIPLIFRDAAQAPTGAGSVDAVVQRLYQMMRDIARSSLNALEKQQQMHALMDQHPEVFSSTRAQRPRTPADAALWMESQFFLAAAELAPDPAARNRILGNVPPGYGVEPNRPFLMARDPHSNLSVAGELEPGSEARPWWGAARLDADSMVLDKQTPPAKVLAGREPVAGAAATVVVEAEADAEEDAVEVLEVPAVAVLTDEAATVEMHDDTTVLRDVTDDAGDLVLFNAIHIWAGGAVQYEGYSGEDLFTARADGDRTHDMYVRRGEMIVRASYREFGEIKFQYDLDSNVWRDLYWRSVDQDNGRTITLGNQDEPMGMDNLLGNKFTMASEISAPASAFGAYKGIGVRVSNWFENTREESIVKIRDAGTSYVTTSLGLFTQDIEDSSDTDFAVTGRITSGREIAGSKGLHIGLSGSWRKGKYDRIAPRPGVYDADRIPLARPNADAQAVVGLEAMVSRGPAILQAEVYYSDYRGGKVDAQGVGGYAQVGWLFGGAQYEYRPQWGLVAPVSPGGSSVFEAFIQGSYTRGDDDVNSSNELKMLTVGGSWYVRKFRTSINAIYSRVDRDVLDQDTGLAAVARLQYLF